MKVEKKQIKKEDGRYLVFYHFPESAEEEQRQTFDALAEPAETLSAPTAPVGATSETDGALV